MKNLICGTLAILLATLIAAAMPTEAEARIYEDTIRLHILAASDSAEDQELKLTLRDKLLKKYSSVLSSAQDTEDAAARIQASLSEIEADCNSWVEDAGYNYTVRATLTHEWYSTRVYEEFTLPEGCYTSLKIEIGEATGKNWWCVMFPPLCLDVATEHPTASDTNASYTKEETALITAGKYNIKFKLLELFSKCFF